MEPIPPQYSKYEVSENETVVSISVKFGMSTALFKKINRLPLNAYLHPGQIVLVKGDRVPQSRTRSTIRLGRELDRPLLVNLRQRFDRNYLIEGLEEPEQTSGPPSSIPQVRPPFTSSSSRSSPVGFEIPLELKVDQSTVYKESVCYIIDQKSVCGTLTCTPDIIIFEPKLDQEEVTLFGLMKCQTSCFLPDTLDARILKLSYRERISLGIGNPVPDDKPQLFLQLSIKKEIPPLEVSEEEILKEKGKFQILYFLVQEEAQEGLENTLKKNLPKCFHENTSEMKNLKKKYGPYVGEKLFPNVNESEETAAMDWEFVPELIGKSQILTDDDVAVVDSFLPSRSKLRDWELLYCTGIHGISMQTFYNKTRDMAPSLLFVEDKKGNVFGAYVSEAWEKQKGFYGTGETFLFKLRPKEQRMVWRWTEKNNYIMMSNDDEIAVGAGRNSDLEVEIMACGLEKNGVQA